VRNIFDQYTQAENRLTHALVSSLDADPKLLQKFVRWITNVAPPKSLKIVEQQLPGEFEQSEVEYERKGLPDAWIHDDAEWSVDLQLKLTRNLHRIMIHPPAVEYWSSYDIHRL